ncbi:MAG: diguanylate cyclase [Schwartzia sp.]|nr:diguanylate cyclase [Schwartzia sp. (in: firmicutes)]
MRSLRTKITLMTVCVILIALTAVTLSSVIFIQTTERRKSDQLLLLLCETGKRNLDYYFTSVQKSVRKVAAFVESDLEGLDEQQLKRHMERTSKYFNEMASKTNGVLTYYYRIDPAVSKTVKGFWYTNLDGNGFTEHEVTDITLYDTSDTSKLVWFTVPKHKGKPIWLPPYVTDNLGMRVISYNVPIYYERHFIGVVGIEIDYSTMAEQVDSLRLYNNGFAFLSDAVGRLFYHPRTDVTQLTEDTQPSVPDGILSKQTFTQYTFEGVKKQAAWLPLSNGMRLNVAVPITETEGDWQSLIGNILIVAFGVLVAASAFTMYYTKRITKPLEELTEAAELVDKGHYNIALGYDGDDEVGRLTNTFKRLTGHVKEHISNLNRRAYVDALTSVRNKWAYASFIDDLQTTLDSDDGQMKFAVGIFDCDGLKAVNDKYGHEKGDVYIRTASRLMCHVFQHSPVFRLGGDEFSIILQNEDFRNREDLIRAFKTAMAESCAATENEWEQVRVSFGIAVYEPKNDSTVSDVARRADKIMYENKRLRKAAK